MNKPPEYLSLFYSFYLWIETKFIKVTVIHFLLQGTLLTVNDNEGVMDRKGNNPFIL